MDRIQRKVSDSAIKRITTLNTHFEPCFTMQKASVMITIDGQSYQEVIEHMPFKKVKLDYLKKQGWGYTDSEFQFDKEKKLVSFSGNKYMYSGGSMPDFYPWVVKEAGFNFDN